ncbi:hypothetical protein [Oryzomicrobium sp.]|uniref:hypothetical protein n=1 Tax=Oryzomicrobium sp. TaxID=1911578 RepID=UPI0025D1744B|nr:hypothetical protein [Oryzomicrobium sp.]MCE1243756.1 hypothetical protein [Oryzomicrobium sp.]
MPRRNTATPSRRQHPASPRQAEMLRQTIASTAARLIAEDGSLDYELAKRKAARQLNLADGEGLPTNAEVESALRTHQALYQGDEQRDRLQGMRQVALEAMREFERFSPYLTGSVLDGTAGRYAEIDLLLYPDSAKDVEIYLLNRNIPFEHVTPRHDRVEAVLQLDWHGAPVNLVIYPPDDERVTFRSRDGRVRERARREAVESLVAANA